MIPLLAGADATAVAFACVLARVAGIVGGMPLLGDGRLPKLVATSLVSTVTIAVIAARPDLLHVPPMTPSAALLAILSEALLGLAAGLSARIVLSTVQAIGELFSGIGGLSMAQMLDPMSGGHSDASGALMSLLGGMLLMAVGAPALWIASAFRSFETLPVGTLAISAERAISAALAFQTTAGMAIALAAPVIGAQIVGHLALAIAGKAAQKANLFYAIGFLVPLAVGGFALFLTLPILNVRLLELIEIAHRTFGGWLTPL